MFTLENQQAQWERGGAALLGPGEPGGGFGHPGLTSGLQRDMGRAPLMTGHYLLRDHFILHHSDLGLGRLGPEVGLG